MIPAHVTRWAEPRVRLAAGAARMVGAQAAIVVEDGPSRVGSLDAISMVLEACGYSRQAALVAAHDPRCGIIVVTCTADGGALTSVSLAPAAGCA